MPKTRSPSVLGSGRVLYLPTARIRPNPMQPRKHFDTGGLQELAGSIRQYGVLQPLTVRKAGGAYELVAGERRLRAARLAGLTEVPCLLADVDEEASGMLALVENLQRRDLDYIEEAEGLQKLMQQYHLSQEQAARRIGKSQSAVANKLRILRHPPSVLQALREHHLTERHARALLRLPDEEERLRVIGLIVQGEWTVAKTEQYIDARLAPKAPQRRELGTFVLRDVRVFLNSIDHQLDLVRGGGGGRRAGGGACGRPSPCTASAKSKGQPPPPGLPSCFFGFIPPATAHAASPGTGASPVPAPPPWQKRLSAVPCAADLP